MEAFPPNVLAEAQLTLAIFHLLALVSNGVADFEHFVPVGRFGVELPKTGPDRVGRRLEMPSVWK